jgi:hypothetical protein
MEWARSDRARRAALGGIVGPVAFVGAWAVLGSVKSGYSALHDPISDLAAVHASTRIEMTAGFVVFAAGMGSYARALRATQAGAAWIAAAVTGITTLGVAAFPLHHSATVDRIHGSFAGAGYVALAATAWLSVAPVATAGRRAWARAATACGIVSAIALALTLTGSYDGLLQRVGLTAGDVWVVASAVAIARGSRAVRGDGR